MMRYACLALLVLGCSESSSSRPEQPVDLNGTWRGEWVSVLATHGSVDLDLTYADERATGRGDVTGSACFLSVEALLFVNDRRVVGQLSPPNALYAMLIDGEVSRNSRRITGTFAVQSGSVCQGETGTFELSR